MTSFNAHNQYRQNSVYTASPEELTLMLYNGLIKFIMKAKDATMKKDIEGANNNIIRAQDIINEFIGTLDQKYEVSKGLLLLYDYMYRRLLEANINKDEDILEEVLDFAKQLRDTWEQAMKIAKKEKNKKPLAVSG